MSTKVSVEARRISTTNGYGIRTERGTDGSVWYWGTVKTPLGYVYVYSEQGHASLSVIRDGYEYTKIVKTTFSKRGLVTVARRFIEEMAA